MIILAGAGNASGGSIPIPITWTDLVGMTESPTGTITGSAGGWGTQGAASVESITGDGELIHPLSDGHTGGNSKLIGLSTSNANANYTSIGAGFLIQAGSIFVWNGSGFTFIQASNTTDTTSMKRVGTNLEFYINAILVHTISSFTTSPLIVDVAMENNGFIIAGVQIVQ